MDKYILRAGSMVGVLFLIGAVSLFCVRLGEDHEQSLGYDQTRVPDHKVNEEACDESVPVFPARQGLSVRSRDVFAFETLPENVTDPAASERAFRVAGLIISIRPGVVLEDTTSGAVVFLSEGETRNGVSLLGIGKDGVRMRADGRDLSLSAPRGWE